MANEQFPKRLVLGIGYPWAYGLGPYYQVGLNESPFGVEAKKLNWSVKLWASSLPRYRLILERLEDIDV